MSKTGEKSDEVQANTIVGACLGTAAGAIIAAVLLQDSLQTTLGSALGAVVGGLIGSRSKSQMGQYMYFVYSKKAIIQLYLSGILFLGFLLSTIFYAFGDRNQTVKLVLASAAALSSIPMVYAVRYAINELDDLLKNIMFESLAAGTAIAFVMFTALGVMSLVIDIPSNWLMSMVVIMFGWLLGRIIVARKYR